MKTEKIILVSGMSGAGKSSVIGILEDIGYLCIDNLPLTMIDDLFSWIDENEDERYKYLALSTTALDFKEAQIKLASKNYKFMTIFVDAKDDVLVHRFQFTRRKHPFIVDGSCTTLSEAIRLEREYFGHSFQDVVVLDTSSLSLQRLREAVENIFRDNLDLRFTISFISFGYRYGLPLDADLVFDCRILKNPFWNKELKELTGNDKAVQDYVLNDDVAQELIKKMTDYFDFAFANFINNQKSHLSVAIGCTGGKHRSVSVVNYFYQYYFNKYRVLKLHRDVERVQD